MRANPARETSETDLKDSVEAKPPEITGQAVELTVGVKSQQKLAALIRRNIAGGGIMKVSLTQADQGRKPSKKAVPLVLQKALLESPPRKPF